MAELAETQMESEGSKKTSWIKMKPDELIKIILEFGKKGESPAKIGLILRDKYGIPKAKILLGKGVAEILNEHGITYKSEKDAVTENVNRIKGHLEKNKKDYSAKKALAKKTWVLNKLKKF